MKGRVLERKVTENGLPMCHIRVFGSVRDKPEYERAMHWKSHIEAIYTGLGYGDVTVSPTRKAIDEYEELKKHETVGA